MWKYILFSREGSEVLSEVSGFERVNRAAEATHQAASLLLVSSAGAECL